jgi:autophagy-related protein 18
VPRYICRLVKLICIWPFRNSGSIRKRSIALGRNLSGSVGGYLPNSLAEMWEPSRDFAFLKLPSNGVSSVVAISNTSPQIMCVTSEGLFYCYNIDLESGGECTLMKRELYT